MGGELSGELARAAGVALVARHLAELLGWCRRISGGDEGIETVHQARIHTRRLRTALELFGHLVLPPLEKRLRKLSRELGRSLGRVRDADVFLRHLSRQRPRGQ